MNTPFNMIIVGMTNCGKSRFIITMLEENFNRHFDYIILLCPTLSYNKTYQEWKYINDSDLIKVECDQDQVDIVLKYVSDVYKGTNTLIILDDCAIGLDVKNRTVRLGFSARHYGLSTIVISQQLTSVSKPYRENISYLVTFYNTNRNDMKTIFDDYLYGVEKDDIEEITKKLKNNKYAHLEIQLVFPYKWKIVIPAIKHVLYIYAKA